MLDRLFQQGPRPSAAIEPSLFISRQLEPVARDIWEAALSRLEQSHARGEDIALEGEQPRFLFVILEGWAQKYRELPDGRRQIVGFCLPGQVCDIALLTRTPYGHTVAAIDRLRVAAIGPEDLDELIDRCPGLGRALCEAEAIAGAIQREWLVNVGVKSAHERIAHLLCELYMLQGGGAARAEVDFPVTQAQIGEATGLTSVHVNRVMRELHDEYGVDFARRRLRIANFDGLARTGSFTGGYLGAPRPVQVEFSGRIARSLADRSGAAAAQDSVARGADRP